MRDQRLEIKDIVKHIDDATRGKLDVPEFQRKFVWTPEKTKKFVDSLWRGYPVGAFLLWESTYASPKTALGVHAQKQWIVDGQQRITSLALLFGKKPYWWGESSEWNKSLRKFDVLVNVSLPSDALEFGLPNPVRKNSPEWVSVRSILASSSLSELAEQISKRDGCPGFAAVHETLQSVRRIESFPIFEIIIDHELEDVAEIFSRLNTAGTKIKESDVIIALVAAKQAGWVREEFDQFLKDLDEKGFQLDPSVLIRTLAVIGKGAARLKEIPSEFWDSSKEFDKAWRNVKDSISFVHRNLVNHGVLSSDLLPAHNALIPLFFLHAHFQREFNFDRGFRWFLLAIGDGRYSGSATTTLDFDIRLVKSSKSFDEAVVALEKQLRISGEFTSEDFQRDYREDFYRLMLYLCAFRREAKDWMHQSIRVGFDRTDNQLNEGFKPEWHHFFAKKVLRKHDADETKINSLANIVVLNEKANRSFSSKEPLQYLKEFEVKAERLKEQFVPTQSGLWEVAKYEELLDARSKLLAQAATDLLKDLADKGSSAARTGN
jgi:hypothetical protein